MCRIIAAPEGIAGKELIPGFLRMAQGLNSLNEYNRFPGQVRHGDGWGVVFVSNGQITRYRSLLPCWKDDSLRSFERKTVLALHARRATQGPVCDIENVHPFRHRTEYGMFHFIHNGTVRDTLPVNVPPMGSTDSELLFYLLLEALENGSFDDSALLSAVNSISSYSALNACLIGERSMWVIAKVQHPSLYYTMHLRHTEYGPVIASEPIADLAEDWMPMDNGSVIHFAKDRSDGVY